MSTNLTHPISSAFALDSNASTLSISAYPPLFSVSYLPYTTLLCLVLTWICSSAGIGGSALDTVVFVSIMGLPAKQISPITKALVFGESLGGFLINFRRSHPFYKRPLINYEVALAFEPFSLLGTLWGVYANQSLPSYVILAGLVLVLGFASFRTFHRAINLCKSEEKLSGPTETVITMNDSEVKTSTEEVEDPENDDFEDELNEDVKEDQKAEETVENQKEEIESTPSNTSYNVWHRFIGKIDGINYFPWKLMLLLFGNWILLALFNLLTGNLEIQCGSVLFWGVSLITIPVFSFLAIVSMYILWKLEKKRENTGYLYVATDVKWTIKKLFCFVITSLITGILAAMFGLGGGTLNSPTMLELGLVPAQVPATSGVLILLTSSVAIFQYVSLGRIQYDYLLWYIAVGFIGGVSGHLGIRAFIKKYNKQSIVVFLLASLIFLGMVVLLYTVSMLFVSGNAVMSVVSPCAK